MKLDRPGARALLLESYAAAVGAADPLKIVAGFLPPPHAAGKTLVVGAGKAAASMALAVEQAYAGRAQLEGLVVTRYAHGLPTERIRVIEAGHPVPDEAGEQAALEILERVSALTGNDRLIVLVSGGGSSLLSLPADGIPMADLKAVTRELLRCGAPITDMNIVRKHVSRIQGGRLAAASRAPVTTLIVSDVAGDDPSAIASGPTVPDPSTYADALAILRRWGAQMPDTVRTHLERGARGEIAETPKPGDPCFGRVSNHIIATAQQSLQAAAQVFAARGIRTAVLGDTVTGEAREVAQVYGALARQIRQHGTPFAAPVALISGGECTVTIPPGLTGGRGGRCAGSCSRSASRWTAWTTSTPSPPIQTASTDRRTMRARCSIPNPSPVLPPGALPLAPRWTYTTPMVSSRPPMTSSLPGRRVPTSTTTAPSSFSESAFRIRRLHHHDRHPHNRPPR